ncbi:MAG TPA: DUF2130 domain-containing protein [Steroidobacteraceae bacterium]|nr:DUF2130 domain-containing protein [Steroidobacteraceae bacterium]
MTATTHPAGQLLLEPSTRVTCPQCEHEFSLADGFARKSLESLEQASSGALTALREEARALEERRARERASQNEALLRERLQDLQGVLDAQRKQHDEALARMQEVERAGAEKREAALRAALGQRETELQQAEAQRAALDAKARALAEQEANLAQAVERRAVARAEELGGAARAELEARLQAQQAQLAQYREVELQLRRERELLEAKQQQLEVDVQRRLDAERTRIAETARAAESERAKLREAELQKKLDATLDKLGDTQRQLEQGSQQLQGEVLELILEEELTAAFPFDTVSEVKKGARGADALQRVATRMGQQAGIILWEAKRAQKWSAQWAPKLKEDMREAGAEVGVIVTTCFPPDWPSGQPFGAYEDVWLTGPGPAIALASALRAGLLDAYKARLAAANKDEKMEAVYDYLTSPQFAHKLRAVYDSFKKMREELDSERTTLQQRWKRREKQIQLATNQLIAIAGDVQGLAQQELPQLELEQKALEEPAAEYEADEE